MVSKVRTTGEVRLEAEGDTVPDLSGVDDVLATTRSVRRNLDLTRSVPRDVIIECLELAVQAPTASNRQSWRFVVVTEPDVKAVLADLYVRGRAATRAAASHMTTLTPIDPSFVSTAPEERPTAHTSYESQMTRVMASADFLFEHMKDVPGMLIPCIDGRPPKSTSMAGLASHFGSIIQAAWSFMLAARARRIGSVWTTAHLGLEEEAAAALGIPFESVTQVALIPFGYVIGEPFKRADRPPIELVTRWENWHGTA
jgi:nitroreductase